MPYTFPLHLFLLVDFAPHENLNDMYDKQSSLILTSMTINYRGKMTQKFLKSTINFGKASKIFTFLKEKHILDRCKTCQHVQCYLFQFPSKVNKLAAFEQDYLTSRTFNMV